MIHLRYLIAIVIVSVGCSPQKENDDGNITTSQECYVEENEIDISSLSEVAVYVFGFNEPLLLGQDLSLFENGEFSSEFTEISNPSQDSTITTACSGDKFFIGNDGFFSVNSKQYRLVQYLSFYSGKLFEYELMIYGQPNGQSLEDFESDLKDKLPEEIVNWMEIGKELRIEIIDPFCKKKFYISNGNSSPILELEYSWGSFQNFESKE